MYVIKYAVINQLLWEKPWRSFVMETVAVLTMVISKLMPNIPRKSLQKTTCQKKRTQRASTTPR